jgi:hypothetical protein
VARLQRMAQEGHLKSAPQDEVSFPFWRVVFGIAPPRSSIDQMYETEAAQILARSENPALLEPVSKSSTGTSLTPAEAHGWREAFLAEPDMSNHLRARLGIP